MCKSHSHILYCDILHALADQVKAQLRRGNAELARANLAKEGLLGELRNQIAIIRCGEPCTLSRQQMCHE